MPFQWNRGGTGGANPVLGLLSGGGGGGGSQGPLDTTVEDTAYLSNRLGLVNQYAPELLEDDGQDAIIQLAQDHSQSDDEFMTSVLQARGEAHISNLHDSLEKMTPLEARAYHSQLSHAEQRLLDEDGFVVPEAPSERKKHGLFGFNLPSVRTPEWILPGDAGGGELFDAPEFSFDSRGGVVGKVGSAIGVGVTLPVTAVSQGFHAFGETSAKAQRLYQRLERTSIDMEQRGVGEVPVVGSFVGQDKQTADRGGVDDPAQGVAGVHVTGGGVGNIFRGGWRRDFRKSWQDTEKGELHIPAPKEAQALDTLDGDQDRLDLAFQFAQGKMPEDVAKAEGLVPGTPEFNKKTVEYMRVRFDPKMDEAMGIINDNKQSLGRYQANKLGLKPNTRSYDMVSGAYDGGAQLVLDPTLIALPALKAADAAYWGIKLNEIRGLDKTLSAIDQAAGLKTAAGSLAAQGRYTRRVSEVLNKRGLFGQNRFQKVGQKVIDALDPSNPYSATDLFREAPEVTNSYAAMRKWHRVQQLRESGYVGAGAKGGIDSMEGYADFWKTTQGAAEVVASKAAGLGRDVRYLPGMSYKRQLATMAKSSVERWIDWSIDQNAKFFGDGSESLLNAENIWSAGPEGIGLQASAAPRMVNIPPGRFARFAVNPAKRLIGAPGATLGALVRQQPRTGGILDLVGKESISSFKNFTNMGMFFGVPTQVTDDYINAFAEAGNLQTKQHLVTRFVDEMMHRSGLADTPDGAKVIDEFVNNTKQIYGIGPKGEELRRGLYPNQVAHMMSVPDVHSLLGISRNASFTRRITGAINPKWLDGAIGNYWKPSVVLRLGFIPRAVADELLGEMARYGAGAYLKSKVLTMNWYRHGTADKLADKGWTMFGNKGWLMKHIEEAYPGINLADVGALSEAQMYETMAARPFAWAAHNLNNVVQHVGPLARTRAGELTEMLEDHAVHLNLWSGRKMHELAESLHMPTRQEWALLLGGEDVQYNAEVYKRLLTRNAQLQRSAAEVAATRVAGRPESWADNEQGLRVINKVDSEGNKVAMPLKVLHSDERVTYRPGAAPEMDFDPETGNLLHKDVTADYYIDTSSNVATRVDNPIGDAGAKRLQGVVDDELVDDLGRWEDSVPNAPVSGRDELDDIIDEYVRGDAGFTDDSEFLSRSEQMEGIKPLEQPSVEELRASGMSDEEIDAFLSQPDDVGFPFDDPDVAMASARRGTNITRRDIAIRRAQRVQEKFDALPEALQNDLKMWAINPDDDLKAQIYTSFGDAHRAELDSFFRMRGSAQSFLTNSSKPEDFVYGYDEAVKVASDAAYREAMKPGMAQHRANMTFFSQTADGRVVETAVPDDVVPLYSTMASPDVVEQIHNVDQMAFRLHLTEELEKLGYTEDDVVRILDDFLPNGLNGLEPADMETVRRLRNVQREGGYTPVGPWTSTDPEQVQAINRALAKSLPMENAEHSLAVGRNHIPLEDVQQSTKTDAAERGVRAFTRNNETWDQTTSFGLDQRHLTHTEAMPEPRQVVRVPKRLQEQLVERGVTVPDEMPLSEWQDLAAEHGVGATSIQREMVDTIAHEVGTDQQSTDVYWLKKLLDEKAKRLRYAAKENGSNEAYKVMFPEMGEKGLTGSRDELLQMDAMLESVGRDLENPAHSMAGFQEVPPPEVTERLRNWIVDYQDALKKLREEGRLKVYWSGGATEAEAARDWADLVGHDLVNTFSRDSTQVGNPLEGLGAEASPADTKVFKMNHAYLRPAAEGRFRGIVDLMKEPQADLPFKSFGPHLVLPEQGNVLQKIFNYGFDKVITPALNSMQRGPQWIAAAGSGMKWADTMADILVRDHGLTEEMARLATSKGVDVDMLRRAWATLPEELVAPNASPAAVSKALHQVVEDEMYARLHGVADKNLGRSLAAYDAKTGAVRLNTKAIQKDYEAGLAHLKGEGSAASSAQKAEVFRRHRIDVDKLHAWFESHGGAEAYQNFIMEHEYAHAILGHAGTPTSELMSDAAIGREMAANTLALKRAGVDLKAVAADGKKVVLGTAERPQLTMSGEEIAKLRRHTDNFEAAENYVSELTGARATMEAMNFIDDNRLRSQFQQYVSNLVPFHFAEEQFYKRWAKTLRQSPVAIRKAQLTMQAFRNMGILQHDTFGNEVIVYPTNAPGMDVIQQMTGLFFAGSLLPAGQQLTGQVTYLMPGFDSFSEGRPGFAPGPFVGVMLKGMANLYPELRNAENAILGDRASANPNILEMFIPTQIQRFVRPFLDPASLQGDAIGAAQYLAAIDPDGSKGLYINDQVTEAGMERFKERVVNHSRILAVFKAIVGMAAPAAPAVADHGSLRSAVSTAEWDPNFTDLLKSGMPIDEAVSTYIEYEHKKHPHFDPTPYTVFATKSTAGSPMATTNEGLQWVDDNAEVIDTYKYAAPWLGPQPDTSDTFSRRAYYDQTVHGLRVRKTAEEFILDLKFAQAASDYFDRHEQYLIDKVTLDPGTDEYRQATQGWSKWSRDYKNQHPWFAKQLDSNEGRDRRQKTLEQMDAVLESPDFDRSPQAPGLRAIMGRWHALQNRLFILKSDSRSEAEELKKSYKLEFANWGKAQVLRDPRLRAFWESVIWPEMNIDGDILETPEVVESVLNRAS